MAPLPQNRLLRGFLQVAMIAIVIAYSWLGARMLEERFELPSELVKASVWVGERSVVSLHDVRSMHWRELARIESEAKTAVQALRWIGSPGRRLDPVELVIRGDRTERLLVTGARIEISPDIVMARGQLTKAFLKSYLLQKGSTDLVGSHLRLDVVSDVLLAMAGGGLALEAPGRSSTLSYTEIRPWWSYARSYLGVCDSEWRSVELLPICHARETNSSSVSMLSFRPLIGAILWQTFAAQPVASRYAFIEKWIRSLSRASVPRDELNEGTKARLLAELETLLPHAEFPEVSQSMGQALASARLEESPQVEADLLIETSEVTKEDARAVSDLLARRPGLAVFAHTKQGWIGFPGLVALDPKEVSVVKAKHSILETCESPKLKDIATRSAAVKKLIWIKRCGGEETPLVLSPLFSVGMEGFARANPQATFIQFRPEGVAFALRTGRAKEPWFGLASASWVDSAGAYKVNGAIEAVEWTRTAKAGQPISAEF